MYVWVSSDKHPAAGGECAFNVGESDLYLKVGWCSQVGGGFVSEPLKSHHEGESHKANPGTTSGTGAA